MLTESVRKYAPNFRASVAIDVAIEIRAIFRVAFIAIFLQKTSPMIRTGPAPAFARALAHYATCARRKRNRAAARANLRVVTVGGRNS
jgi:hypothetical protein